MDGWMDGWMEEGRKEIFYLTMHSKKRVFNAYIRHTRTIQMTGKATDARQWATISN